MSEPGGHVATNDVKKKIAVLFDENDRRRAAGYTIATLAKYWRDESLEVIFLFGIKQFVPADLILVHVNLSVVPERYFSFAAQYPVVLNGNVRDIRKSAFSQNLLGPGDAYDGKVIVKTDLNHAGLPEKKRRRLHGLPGVMSLQKLVSGLGLGRGTPLPEFTSQLDYQIYESLSEVPAACFASPDLVVEKFLPEMDDGLFWVRYIRFLGDRMDAVRLGGPSPIVSGQTQIRREIIEPDPEILALRHKLKFDYGKFDYTLHDGKAVLLDINKTVGAPAVANPPHIEAKWRSIAGGIHSYFS